MWIRRSLHQCNFAVLVLKALARFNLSFPWRPAGNMSGLSGGQGMVYTEFSGSRPGRSMFKQRYKN